MAQPTKDGDSTEFHPVADVLVATHKELGERTKSGLARATARAAEAAATAPEPLEVSNTAQLRDITAAASRLFGWDKREGAQVQLNQLMITHEQLQQIRQLREPVAYEAPRTETPPEPFPSPAPYGRVDGELKITSDGIFGKEH
jgi:hypothetical protein